MNIYKHIPKKDLLYAFFYYYTESILVKSRIEKAEHVRLLLAARVKFLRDFLADSRYKVSPEMESMLKASLEESEENDAEAERVLSDAKEEDETATIKFEIYQGLLSIASDDKDKDEDEDEDETATIRSP